MSDKEATTANNRLQLRLTDEELARLTRMQERLQADAGQNIKVTMKAVIFEALEMLETRYAKLEKDRGRKR